MQTKEEKREYNRQYRLKNKEKIKQYRIDNKERIRETRIKYDLKNKEKIKLQQQEYKNKNKEKIKEYQQQYYFDNKERIKECPSNSPEERKKVYKKYRRNNQDKIKDYKLRKKYGISLEDYNKIFNDQNSCCMICKTHQDELNKKLVVDHNHNTGKVRGLLCDKCNRGLGQFNDEIEIIRQALDYLSTYIG